MTEFRKTTRDGRAVTITPDPRTGFFTARVAGAVVYTGMIGRVPASAKVPAGYTMSAGPVLLTDAEVAQVRALMDEAAAAWALTPDGLAAKRESLALRLNAMIAGTADRRLDAFDADTEGGYADGMGGYRSSGQEDRDEAAITVAGRELAEFDAAHPEILAALRAKRDADVLRWMER